MVRLALISTLFPYTTLFRSCRKGSESDSRESSPSGPGSIVAHMEVTPAHDGELQDRLRSEEHTSELQSLRHLVCRLLLEKKNEMQTCEEDEAVFHLRHGIAL